MLKHEAPRERGFLFLVSGQLAFEKVLRTMPWRCSLS